MVSAAGTLKVRAPQVAGAFYPAGREVCAETVARCLAGARPAPPGPAKVIVAPHAGYAFSGPVAGTAFSPLATRRREVRRVVICGPAHRVRFRGLAAPTADVWETPLGPVGVDWQAMQQLMRLPGFRLSDAVYAREHSLETHLPFLQRVLDGFRIVPILVGDASAADVLEALRAVWGGPDTLISISSDLSHYRDYDTASRLDAGTARLVELLKPGEIGSANACGHRPLGAVLQLAREHDLRVTALDIRNSGDTQGRRDRVVGYGAFAMEYAEAARIGERDRARLLAGARRSLLYGAKHGRAPQIRLSPGLPPSLTAMRASFVTLKIGGRLRGCMGSVGAHRSLLLDVAANAWKAGFGDPRFGPATMEELARAELDISVLSTPRPIRFADETDLARRLRPDADGLILQDGDRRSLFLPGVWETIPRADRFVALLKRKAGMTPDSPSDTLRAFRFTAESFGAPFRAG